MTVRSNLLINAASILAAATRQDVNGVSHLIVPVIAARVGVMNGLYYSEDALSTSVPVSHPKNGEQFLSANTPEGSKTNIGHFYHVNFDTQTQALKGQLFLNIPRAELLGYSDLITRLESGEQIDVSTGLYPNIEQVSGDFNGEAYSGKVLNLYPDHLAILPNEVGACSVKKGCGTHLFNNCEGGNKPCSCKAGQAKPSIWSNAFQTVKKALGFQANEASHEEIRDKIRAAIRASLSSTDYWPYIMDVYDNFFVYELDSLLFKQGYGLDAADAISLIGEPIQVTIKRDYVPINPVPNHQSKNMKPHIIGILAGLLATNSITTAEKASIESLKPDALDKLFPEPTANAAAPAVVIPAYTTATGGAGGLNPEERQLFDLLKANAANQKTNLVAVVTKAFPAIAPAVIANMDLAALSGLAASLPGANNLVDFSGAAGAFNGIQHNADQDNYVAPSILTRTGD